MDRLSAFLGRPVKFNGVNIYSPTIREIEEIGEVQYRIYLLLSFFDKEKILFNLFGVNESDFEGIDNIDDYEVLTQDPRIAEFISQGLSFFVKGTIHYNPTSHSFDYRAENDINVGFLNKENYVGLVDVIKMMNGMHQEEKKTITYKNERARKMMKELEKLRQKNTSSKGDELDLKDMLSILCCDEGNGVNVFNVHQLTIYQVMEQFERLGIKNNRNTILPVWANGNLKEGTKLPEFFMKTKF